MEIVDQGSSYKVPPRNEFLAAVESAERGFRIILECDESRLSRNAAGCTVSESFCENRA